MKVKVVKRKSATNRLLKNLGQKHQVKVGHFKDQGEHESGYTYPELMALHSKGYTTIYFGDEVDVPARPVLDVVKFRVNNAPNFFFNGLQHTSRKGFRSEDIKDYLEDVGERIKQEEQEIIGSPSWLISNKPSTIRMKEGRNTPLEDTGDLKSKVDVRVK